MSKILFTKLAFTLYIITMVISGFAQNSFFVSSSGNNSNPGTMSLPWLSIQYGIDHINGGDTLMVKAGIYSELINIDAGTISGTALLNTVIKAESGTIVDASSFTPNGDQAIFHIKDMAYLVIQGFELQNFETPSGTNITDTPIGVLINGNSNNIYILDNIIHDIKNHSSCDQNSGCGPAANGIAVFGDTPAGIDQLFIINNEIYDCLLSSSEALTLNGNVDGFIVEGNYVHGNNNIAFDFIGYESWICGACTDPQNRARNGMVRYNTAESNSTTTGGGNPWYASGGESAGGFYVDGGHNILFEGNKSLSNDIGFEFGSEHSGKSSESILMVNNYIYNNLSAGLVMGGYNSNSSQSGGGNVTDVHVYNNSFYKNEGWGTEIYFNYRIIDAWIANNIFYGASDVEDNFYIPSNNQNSNVNWLTNIWWANTQFSSGPLPGTKIIVNPDYIDPINGDLEIQNNSPAKDAGLVATNITDWTNGFWDEQFPPDGEISIHGLFDKAKSPRYEGLLDLGADEINEGIIEIIIEMDTIAVNSSLSEQALYLKNNALGYEIKIYDELDQLYLDLSNTGLIGFDLTTLPSGIYLLEVINLNQNDLVLKTIIAN